MREEYIARGDALAVVKYNPNPVEGIQELPAADLVEVVRCGNCEFSYKLDERKPQYACSHDKRTGCIQYLGSEDFCSYGIKKKALE